MSEEMNRKCRPRNTMVQLSTTYYTDPEDTMHSVTDRRTDSTGEGTNDSMIYTNSPSYCVRFDRLNGVTCAPCPEK